MCWSFVICTVRITIVQATGSKRLFNTRSATTYYRPTNSSLLLKWKVDPCWLDAYLSLCRHFIYSICDVQVMLREHEWTKTASPVHVRWGSVPGARPWQELHSRWHQEIIQVGSEVFCCLCFFWIATQLLKMRSSGVSVDKHLAAQMAVCSWMYLCKESLIWWNGQAGKLKKWIERRKVNF